MEGLYIYDALGRMTSRQAVTAENGAPQVTSVFSDAVYNTTAKPHAMDAATTAEGVFSATPQAVTYTGFDKVAKVKQGTDSICYAYGYDRQRILMEEHVCGLTRTKQYWGACEYVTESDGSNTSSLWRTFVAGPYGVFAVVETRSAMDEIHYVLKDNLGSWTTITDGNGTVEQRLSYDAWGNLRDPNTWANYTVGDTFDKPMFDRGYTGHEHLTDFGLINMNGRMYDPVMSTFLSPDRFVQNPMTAMGFNRYSYCMNNPLKYTDPDGEFFIIDSWLAGFVCKFIQTGSVKQSWKEANKRAGNDAKIWGGLFVTDPNKSFLERVVELTSRLSWQAPQTFVGWFWSINTN